MLRLRPSLRAGAVRSLRLIMVDEAPNALEAGSPAPQARTSTWAMLSLLCAIAICCPLTAVLGPLLGLRGLVEINAHPNIRGRGMAMAGISIGVAAMLFWIGGAIWWHYNARIPMVNGPAEELRAGFAGRVDRFKAGFADDGATAPDTDGQGFLRELQLRYGAFLQSKQDPQGPSKSSMAGPASFRIGYLLTFDRGDVKAEAEFVTFGPARIVPNPVFKWKWFRVDDPQRGELIYPESAVSEIHAASQAATLPATQP